MEGIDLSFPSYAQHERMAAALEAIALNGGQNSAEALDAACRQLLDGTNTTRVFWSWYPRAAGSRRNRPSINCFHGLQQQQRRHGMERRIHCEAMIRQYQE